MGAGDQFATTRSRWRPSSQVLCRCEAPQWRVWRGPALAVRVSFLLGRAVVVLAMSGEKRRTPVVVVGAPRAAPLSAEDRQQVVTALAVVIQQWWSGGRGCSTDAARGSDPSNDAAADGHR